MAAVEFSEWWRRVANNRKGERLEKWERRHNLPETPSGLGGRPDGTVSVSLHGCVFGRGFTPDGHDMHIQTRVRRPPTLDTGTTPGPDTWSVVRRQVRQETDWCLLATCQSRLTLTLFSQLSPYPVEKHKSLVVFQMNSNLVGSVFVATISRVQWQISGESLYVPDRDDKELL